MVEIDTRSARSHNRRSFALADDRVADEDVRDPAVRHHLRLAQLRHLNTDGAGLDLQPGDLRKLVRLRVRTKRDAGLGRHRWRSA